MSFPRRRRFVLIALAGVLVAWLMLPPIKRCITGFQQENARRSLAEWGRQYSTITNDALAVDAAEMVLIMQTYYLPGPGYRGPRGAEEALEAQRKASIERVVAALQRYTGLNYGTNAQSWSEWSERRAAEMRAHNRSEQQNGAGNRNRPIPSETNQTSAAAGSGR